MSDYQLRFIGNQKGSEKVNLAEGVQFVALGILGVMMIGAALGVVLFSNVVYSAFMLGEIGRAHV